MMKKRKWWTIQFVPHGKGHVQSYTLRSTLLVFLLTSLIALILISIALTFYFYYANKKMNEQIVELQDYQGENQMLKGHINDLETEVTDLHQEVESMQDWLKEVELLEKQLQEMDTSSSLPTSLAELTKSTTTVKIAARPTLLSSRSSSETRRTIQQTKEKLEQLKKDAELQQLKLIQLKEKMEEEQYLALFIPSIAPSNGRISSLFGWRKDPFHGQKRMHEGIDFVDYFKAPVYASAKGTVKWAEVTGGYGKQVAIDHGNGYITTYSHLTSFSVEKGDKVEKGQIIGRMGSTGRSTGVHLHYEIHKNGEPVNPLKYIQGGK